MPDRASCRDLPHLRLLKHVQYREEMKNGSSEHEKVPEGMRPSDFFHGVHNRTDCIDDASAKKERPAVRGNALLERRRGKDDDPAHQDIHDNRGSAQAVPEHRVERYAGGGQAPYYAENPPAGSVTQYCQAVCGIGSRDKHENCGMIQTLKHYKCFCFFQ